MKTRIVKAIFGIVETIKSSAGTGVRVEDSLTVTGAVAVTGATTLSGAVALAAMPTIPTSTVAAAGSSQTDAGALGTGFVLVSAADGTKGVKLPAAAAGKVVIIKNNANAVCKLYPGTDDKINGGNANAEYSGGLAAYTPIICVAYDATDWYTIPLADS